MELTIAIRKDCKRLLTDNQPITCDRLQPFANINVHVESLVLDRFMSRFFCPVIKRMGEISVTAYDLLNSSMDKRFVNASNYTEMISNANYGRYIAINFTYKFRNVKTPRATVSGVTW